MYTSHLLQWYSGFLRRLLTVLPSPTILSVLIWSYLYLATYFLECAPRIGIKQRSRIQQLEHLNRVRQEHMVAGSPSALAELHSLRHFGHRVAQTEPPTFFLHWSDDGQRVSFGGDFLLSMHDFRRLANHFVTHAEELCDELMLGMEPTHS